MDFELKLAWTYFRARRPLTARFTALVAIIGIASGVASLILAQALTRGFGGEMQDKILSRTAHVTVFQTDSSKIQNWQIVKKELEKIENVREVSPTAYENALIVSRKATGYAVLRAVEGSKFKVQSSTNEELEIKDQRSKVEDQIVEISIGAELAEKMGLKAGDEAEILSAANNYLPRSKTVRVMNTFRTGIYDYDSTWIYISTENFARIFETSHFAPTILSLSVKDVSAAGETGRRIGDRLPPNFKVVDWQEANRPLFAALSAEKKVTLAIISLIIFIAALNITTTLALLVNERRLDIAVLRTCGARSRSLILIFLMEGLFLGLTGIFLGVGSGLFFCFIGNYFKLISLPAEIYSLSYVPLTLNLGDLLLVIAIAFLLSLAATAYPAQKAAKIKPLENLRRR